MVDHRHAGGTMSDAHMRVAGLPAGSGRGLHECPTITCNHCRAIVMVNDLRERGRHWCRHCDRYVCDECAARLFVSGVCTPYAKVREEALSAALRGEVYMPPWSRSAG